jgi:hypothetical protein
MARPGGPSDGLVDLCFELGLSAERTAEVAGISKSDAWHLWSVRTGLPVLTDPPPDEIERLVAEIQSGWSDEVREMARRHETNRPSSKVCEYRIRRHREINRAWVQRKKERAECHSGSTDAKDSPSPSLAIVRQMTLSFESTACEATACG